MKKTAASQKQRALTFLVHGKHQRAVFRVQVRQEGRPDQVLGQVSQQRHGPGPDMAQAGVTHRGPSYTPRTLKRLPSFSLDVKEVHRYCGESHIT